MHLPSFLQVHRRERTHHAAQVLDQTLHQRTDLADFRHDAAWDVLRLRLRNDGTLWRASGVGLGLFLLHKQFVR